MFKKLATLVCAAAMAAGAFTGVVANAAVEREEGVNLTAEKTADDKITVNAYAVGYDSIMGFNLNFGVTGASVKSVNADYAAISGGTYNVASESFVATIASTTGAVSLTDNLMLTITFTFSEDISNDVTITIEDESSVMKGNNVALEYYASDLTDDPDAVTLGFNDVVVKAAPVPQTVPAAVTAVEKQNTDAINGTGEYKAQTADIYGVEITPNDESVSGATITVGEKTKDINFKTVYSGEGTVVFAVILASETGAALPALSADNVTPIVVAVD